MIPVVAGKSQLYRASHTNQKHNIRQKRLSVLVHTVGCLGGFYMGSSEEIVSWISCRKRYTIKFFGRAKNDR